MNCPRDGEKLFPVRYEGDVFVDECTKCKGAFLDRGELEKIEEEHAQEFRDSLSRMPDLVAGAYERARQRAEGELKCPKCGAEMETREYAYCSQVMINKCVKCGGIWLDRGEVKALEIFYEREREGARRGFLSSLLKH
jgi:Zn-finger nucleic acid-binding protein